MRFFWGGVQKNFKENGFKLEGFISDPELVWNIIDGLWENESKQIFEKFSINQIITVFYVMMIDLLSYNLIDYKYDN